MEHKINKWFVIVIGIMFFALCTVNIITPQNAFSETENKTLEQAPSLDFQSVISGSFMKSFEKYSTDQFIFRDQWISFKAMVEKSTGKTENNGVYFAKNDYLIEKQNPMDEKTLTNNINSLMKVDKLDKYNLSFMLIPTSYEINSDYLPRYAYKPMQKEIMNFTEDMLKDTNIKFINPTEILKNNQNEYLYFKTDHHQTSKGSYMVYRAFCEQMGINPYNEEDFDIKELANDFYGTTWSKAMIANTPTDTISAYIPKFDVSYKVDYITGEKKSDSLYEMKNLEKKDKYTVFLDGNHSLLKITTSVNNGKKLAVYKDSYAHSILPFLANHYEEIHVFDLRYYNQNSIEYLEQNNITDILGMYNVSNFNSDTNLVKLGAFIK